jgi:hypothetical protein
MKFSTAEEIETKQFRRREERNLRRVTKDKRSPHGNKNLAQTDGLRLIRKPIREPVLLDDDEPIDLKRVKSLKDVTSSYNDGSDGL